MSEENLTSDPTEITKPMELFIRAFWRRISIYKDKFGKELPEEMPVEFLWAGSVAQTFLHEENSAKASEIQAKALEDACEKYYDDAAVSMSSSRLYGKFIMEAKAIRGMVTAPQNEKK